MSSSTPCSPTSSGIPAPAPTRSATSRRSARPRTWWLAGHSPISACRTSHGAIHRLGDYVGHPLLIVVWVSVHPDFLADLPALERVRDGYGPRGLALLGIDCDISPKHADALPMQMKCPQVIGRQQWQERVVAPFGITSLPMYFLVSAQGMLLQKASRIADLADKLNAAFAAP